MNASKFTTLGVDVGGTKIAAGVVNFPEGIVRTRREIPTLPQRGGEAVLVDLERLVSGLATEARADGRPVQGIGVGVCEIVDRSGEIASANCLDWTSDSVRQRFSSIAPTVIEADVRAAARAEALFGAGRNAKVFLYVSIGTGIASCLVIDGQPFAGARGATGTMASVPLPGFDEVRTSGLLPTLEQVASGPALVSRFNQLHGNARSGQEVMAAAVAGDERAARVVRSAAEAVGGTIGLLVNVLDPELIVLGGGLGASMGLYRDTLIDAARRRIWWDGHRDLLIVSATTGVDAGLIGAAAFACFHLATHR
jgi:predicted NBD/HSP70 family sugar kinase